MESVKSAKPKTRFAKKRDSRYSANLRNELFELEILAIFGNIICKEMLELINKTAHPI